MTAPKARLILGYELELVRRKIACPQFGDRGYGEWGILTLHQRQTIFRMIETIKYLDSLVEMYSRKELEVQP